MYLQQVKEYIISIEEEMKRNGMNEVFIKDNNLLPAVLISLKNEYKGVDDSYWRKMRENIRNRGAEYVSNIYEDDSDDDIDEDYKKLI